MLENLEGRNNDSALKLNLGLVPGVRVIGTGLKSQYRGSAGNFP